MCAVFRELGARVLLPRSLPTETGAVRWQIRNGTFGPGVEDAVSRESLLLRVRKVLKRRGEASSGRGFPEKGGEFLYFHGARAGPHMPGTCLPHGMSHAHPPVAVSMPTKSRPPQGRLGRSFRHHLGSSQCKPVSESWASAVLWFPTAAQVAWLDFCLLFF